MILPVISLCGCLTISIFFGQSRQQESQALPTSGTQEQATSSAAGTTQPTIDMNVERARRELRLLDDMYKTSIVLITDHYVNSDEDLPAGEAFKLQFAAMQKKGWHEVKLLDATGHPLNPSNKPRRGFETKAVAELLKNNLPLYEEIIEEEDQRFLRATTAIPVVMDKCIMCHDNYANLPDGKAIGAISFKIPILDNLQPIEPQLPNPIKNADSK